MDPISQGVVGAIISGASQPEKHTKIALLCGIFAGISADIDVFISSSTDPLLFLEYHRQFTHSLAFIPFGAAICAGLLWFWARQHISFRRLYVCCFLGFASHGLLDTCTTYGTQLLWPFSDERFAWNIISIIDPLFTIPLCILSWLAYRQKKRLWLQIALIWMVIYFTIGIMQHLRASKVGAQLAAERQHQPVQISSKPAFANLLIWKTVYQWQGDFYVDAVRVGLKEKTYTGSSAAKINVGKHFPRLDSKQQQAIDIERFRKFSNDYLAWRPLHPDRVIDVRYSMLPNEINPLWYIQVNPDSPDEHVKFITKERANSNILNRFWSMILGEELVD
ncbi:MAG: metal-dependent hydrolase [Gammaproteobacteria bacterium]|jgi:inner membrane protein|nr:metal-dependent hydrolase [Gammaproteobacteria bacterium]MBT5600680.1 metal-dependent hydrolase [Gammaproteobacteria bacterium]MBT6244157.1 metal-dependent hydrolase [Gammaproteobacteria bacterium]